MSSLVGFFCIQYYFEQTKVNHSYARHGREQLYVACKIDDDGKWIIAIGGRLDPKNTGEMGS